VPASDINLPPWVANHSAAVSPNLHFLSSLSYGISHIKSYIAKSPAAFSFLENMADRLPRHLLDRDRVEIDEEGFAGLPHRRIDDFSSSMECDRVFRLGGAEVDRSADDSPTEMRRRSRASS